MVIACFCMFSLYCLQEMVFGYYQYRVSFTYALHLHIAPPCRSPMQIHVTPLMLEYSDCNTLRCRFPYVLMLLLHRNHDLRTPCCYRETVHPNITIYRHSRNERYPNPRPVPIPDIVHAEEANKQSLLFYTQISQCPFPPSLLLSPSSQNTDRRKKRTLNPPPEKPPQHHRIPDQTYHIPHDDLRPQPPPEKPKITRMPEISVNPARDEDVTLLLPTLHEMIEIRPRVHHRDRPRALPDHHHRRPEDQPPRAESGR